jgi:hypothetical protein
MSNDVCSSSPDTRLVLGQLYTCTLPPVHRRGGVKRALSTVYLLILSSGQAGEDPPRNTAGGGLDTAGGGLDLE